MSASPPSYWTPDGIFVDDEESAAGLDEAALFDELFDLNSVVEISVDISKEQLATLQADYDYYSVNHNRSAICRYADSVTFTVNGRKYIIDEVGIRLKGATSRRRFYNDLLGIYNPMHLRLCFDRTFDASEDYGVSTKVWKSEEERERRINRTFATMKSIELKWNITLDNTYTRTIYAHEMFRDLGVPTQLCRLSTLRLGGCRMGVYRMYEPVDEGFIRRYFPEEDWGGDLYKVRWAHKVPADYTLTNTYGICSKRRNEYYNFDLKTNLETCDHTSIRRLLEVINRENVTREQMDAVMDSDELAKVMAINYAIGNLDDLRNNYNNQYVYFRKSDGKAVFIPYDNELVLDINYFFCPFNFDITAESPYYSYNYARKAPQRSPLVRQVALRGGFYTESYRKYLLDVADSKWLRESNYLYYYRIAEKNYADKVVPGIHFKNTFEMNMFFSMENNRNNRNDMPIRQYFQRMRDNILTGA